MNVFGVEHDVLSKAAELDSPASAQLEAHAAGWHKDKPHRDCDRCMNPLTQKRAAMRTEGLIARRAAMR